MKKKHLAAVAALLSLAVSPAVAQGGGESAAAPGIAPLAGAGDLQVFAGVRLWANEWDVPFLDQRGLTVVPTLGQQAPVELRDEVRTTASDMEFVPMPTLGVRYGNFLGSMTYFVPTKYHGKGGTEKSVERSELDVNVGYFVLPSVLVSVGYKTAEVDRIANRDDTDQEIDAVLIGISASAPLSERLSLYGNFAYGLARNETGTKDPRGEDRYDARYAIGEFGLAMRLLEGSPNAFLKSVSASIGYRVQSFTVEGIGLGVYDANFNLLRTTTRDLRSSTDGFVLALVASF